MNFENIYGKIYDRPDGEEFETELEELSGLLEGNEEFLESSSRPAFVEGLYQEVKDKVVSETYKEKDFTEIGKDIGATSGLLGGSSVGSNGTDFAATAIDVYWERSLEAGQIADVLLPELSDPNLVGVAAGAVLGTIAGLNRGGKAADTIADHYNRKQRKIYEEKFAEELNSAISEEGWEEYRDRLKGRTRAETDYLETEEDY